MTFRNLSFTEVDNIETELQVLQQGIASNCRLDKRLKNIPGRL